MFPSSVRAAIDDYIGKPIVSVRLLLEGRDTTEPALMQVVETRAGQPLSMVLVRESVTHLFSLGRFEDVRVDATLVDDTRVALRYELSPVHPVTKIAFSGRLDAPGVDEGQLRRAVIDRYGVSPPLGRAAELARLVADLLREHGYLHATVAPRTDIRHDPDRATLVFTIDPGVRTQLGVIDIVGTPSVPLPVFREQLGLVSGTPYQRDTLDARVDRYIEGRQARGYYEERVVPTVRVEDGDRVANLTLTVTPGQRLRIVFTGDPLPSDERAVLVPVEREGSADEDLLEDSTNRIEDYLKTQGYRDALAPHTREQSNGELLITFNVKKGPQYRVDRVEISGNASIPLSEFEPGLRLRAGQPFSVAKLDADVAMIEDLYHRRGYAVAKAQSAVKPDTAPPGAPQVPVVARIVIKEGIRTVVGSVRIEGNPSVAERTLKDGLGLQPGRPYFARQLEVDRDTMRLHYANLGYQSATVDATPSLSADRSHANLVFVVHEGPRVHVNHILIVGNVRTSAATIERELLIKRGDPLGLAAVNESQRRLSALGLFRRARITELRHGDETTRDLLVTVSEAPATTIGYGGGFEVRQRVLRSADDPGIASERLEVAPRASFEIGRRNLFGRNRSVNLFTSVSLDPKDQPCFACEANGSTDPANGYGITEYRLLGQFREPRVFDTTADALVTATLEQQIRSSFKFARRSVGAEVARRLTREVSLSGSYQLQRTRVFDESGNASDRRLIDRIFPKVLLSSFSSSLIRDTRDDAVDPGAGQYFAANGQFAARAIGSEVGFVKSFFTAQMFRTLPHTGRIVLAGDARLGLASGFPRDVVDDAGIVAVVQDLPQSERFYAGGDTTHRGFALDTLGVRHVPALDSDTLDSDGFPLGGNGEVIFNGELRVPVRGGLGLVGFVDSGNVFKRVADIDLGELRTAVGFGLRYQSPVGPIRIDLGFKVHRQEIVPGRREGLKALHISLGQAF